MNKGAPEIELEAYRTAWRELREWLETQRKERHEACSRHDGVVAAIFAGNESMAMSTIRKLQELEKSLDGEKS